MSQEQAKSAHPEKGEHTPVYVSLPGFISDEEAGLGDVNQTSYLQLRNPALRWVRTPGCNT
jgi:hypothetical protein